jgi:hypothetical protein
MHRGLIEAVMLLLCPAVETLFPRWSRIQTLWAKDVSLTFVWPQQLSFSERHCHEFLLCFGNAESLRFRRIPVETFVHDPETLSWFLEQDRKDGRPALIGMLIEGALIGPRQGTGADFKKRASQMFAEGPPSLNTDAIERLRYAITDKLDDLEAERTPAERIAIGAALYPLLVELTLRGSNRWNGDGKWCGRLLNEMNASEARQVEEAFLSLYDGSDIQAVLRLAENILDQHGGKLFSGYHSKAPADWRSPFIRTEL